VDDGYDADPIYPEKQPDGSTAFNITIGLRKPLTMEDLERANKMKAEGFTTPTLTWDLSPQGRKIVGFVIPEDKKTDENKPEDYLGSGLTPYVEHSYWQNPNNMVVAFHYPPNQEQKVNDLIASNSYASYTEPNPCRSEDTPNDPYFLS
jgi:hypothetical protein